MLNTNKVMRQQVDLWFYKGLLKKLREKIKPELVRTVQGMMTGFNLPDMLQTICILKALYNNDDIDRYDGDNTSSDKESNSDDVILITG